MIVSASYRSDIPAFYAEWFRNRLSAGFANVKNLTGGIDRWSQEVDPSVPRY